MTTLTTIRQCSCAGLKNRRDFTCGEAKASALCDSKTHSSSAASGIMSAKRCNRCKQEKPLTDFGNSQLSADGHQPRCRTCTAIHRNLYLQRSGVREIIKQRCRNWYLKNRELAKERSRANGRANKDRRRSLKLQRAYGITLADFNELLSRQHGKCAICDKDTSNRGFKRQVFHVDHDHKTQMVRGLLCSRCNTMLSFFESDHSLAFKALEYLKSPPASAPETASKPTARKLV